MVVYHDLREILALMALIAGFSLAFLVLPDPTSVPTPAVVPGTLPVAQAGAGIEKIPVSVHTLFAS